MVYESNTYVSYDLVFYVVYDPEDKKTLMGNIGVALKYQRSKVDVSFYPEGYDGNKDVEPVRYQGAFWAVHESLDRWCTEHGLMLLEFTENRKKEILLRGPNVGESRA